MRVHFCPAQGVCSHSSPCWHWGSLSRLVTGQMDERGREQLTFPFLSSTVFCLLLPVTWFLELLVPTAMSSAVINEATRIARLFDYPTEQVHRGVAEYKRQMDEGLSQEHTTLSQIPTFVTSVPNGTEKVGSMFLVIWRWRWWERK